MILAKFSSFYPKFAKTAYNAKRVRVLTHHFFKVCRTTRTPKVPKHGSSTIVQKNTIKKIKKEFKRFKKLMSCRSGIRVGCWVNCWRLQSTAKSCACTPRGEVLEEPSHSTWWTLKSPANMISEDGLDVINDSWHLVR